MNSENTLKDRVAIVGVGSTGFSRAGFGRSRDALMAEACIAAIRDAGLEKDQIDGVVGTYPAAHRVVSLLGIPEVTHYGSQPPPIGFSLSDAVHAVVAGAAKHVLVYHPVFRNPVVSRSAAKDPLRRNLGWAGQPADRVWRYDPESLAGTPAYAAWASRHMHEYGTRREHFGYVAINDRTNAGRNPLAAMREPLTMDQYIETRMVRDPLCMLDMDMPVDGADAFVVTSAERARDLTDAPVLVHALSHGATAKNAEDQVPSLLEHGQHVAARALRARSDYWLPDVDVYFPYDGFTFMTVAWLESLGWCGPGEAGSFLEDHWDKEGQRVLIDGKIPLNPHGGSLSEGATQGSGHVREAVTQLRGAAEDRQVADARVALLSIGGFFFNAQGVVLRRA